jgi:alkyl hydroperoxide reductase subunit AhpC
MPQVVTVYKKYHDKGLGIIGISLDEDKEAWKEAVCELGIEWIQMSDLKGWNNAIAMAFNIRAIPHMMVLDESGRIVSYNVEPAELDELCAQKLQ